MKLLPELERPSISDPKYRKYLGKPHLKGRITLDVDLLEVIDEDTLLVLIDDKQLTVPSGTYTSLLPFDEGDVVFHKVFGFRGVVREVEETKIRVEWDNGGESMVALTDVERDV